MLGRCGFCFRLRVWLVARVHFLASSPTEVLRFIGFYQQQSVRLFVASVLLMRRVDMCGCALPRSGLLIAVCCLLLQPFGMFLLQAKRFAVFSKENGPWHMRLFVL